MADRLNAEMGQGISDETRSSSGGEKQNPESRLWREYPLGENGKLCITNDLRDYLVENRPLKKGPIINELGRIVESDLRDISEDPFGKRSVDPFAGTEIGGQRWVNEIASDISEVIGFPVVVKRSLGLESEDLREQFEKMVTLESEISSVLTDEQKEMFGVAKVLAVVSVVEGEDRQDYLFMEKVDGKQMGAGEKVPDDLREAFGIERGYGQTTEMSWNELRYALRQKGLDFDDLKPRNVMIGANDPGEAKYVVLDQGGKYENDGWFVM